MLKAWSREEPEVVMMAIRVYKYMQETIWWSAFGLCASVQCCFLFRSMHAMEFNITFNECLHKTTRSKPQHRPLYNTNKHTYSTAQNKHSTHTYAPIEYTQRNAALIWNEKPNNNNNNTKQTRNERKMFVNIFHNFMHVNFERAYNHRYPWGAFRCLLQCKKKKRVAMWKTHREDKSAQS